MNTRKIFSIFLVTTLMGSSLLPGITNAAIDFGAPKISQSLSDASYNYSSTAKIQKFLLWETKILTYMTKDYKSTVMALKNANAKQAYTTEFADITDNIKEIFANAKYSSDYALTSHIAKLKKEISTYKNLRKELVPLAGSSFNPFSIPETELASIENDIIDFQKIFTKATREALDEYNSSDLKETGKMNMNIEGNFGKIDFSLEKYTSIMSMLTRSQEMDVVAKATFTLNMPGTYTYNKETKEIDQSKGQVISGDASIDALVKIIDQNIYLTLNDYSINTNLTGTRKETFEKGMKELSQYKGKTVKIPVSSSLNKSGTINQAEVLSQLKKVLDVLDAKSLFTVYKKTGDVYTMTLKDDTIQSIGNIYSQKISTEDIAQAKKTVRKIPLLYTIDSGKKILFIQVNEADSKGLVSLALKDGKYAFTVDLKNPNKQSEGVYLLIEKDFMEGKVLLSGVTANMTYKDKNLLFSAEGYAQSLKIEGPLSEENTNVNFTFNGKKVGNMTWKKVADTYTYDVIFEMTISEILSKLHMNGESTFTHGTFPIVAPKDFIEKKITSNQDDEFPVDFNNL